METSKAAFARRLRAAMRQAGHEPRPAVLERKIFELFLRLPVPQRKVAHEVIVALAKANAILPVERGG